MAKNNPTEKQIEAWVSVKTHRRVQINHNYLYPIIRSSHPEVFREKGVLKNFAKFSQENTFARVPFSFGLPSVISMVSVADFEHE